MSASRAEVISLDDGQLIELLRAARRKIFFAGPGMSLPVAQALCEQWIEIGEESVSVMLDIDPETCRVGYCSIEAVKLLHEAASKMGRAIHHRPGIRIGLLICDETTIVFSPVPLLIESESNQFPRPNAVRFDAGPTANQTSVLLQREAEDLIQGGDSVGTDQVELVENDLAENPPLKFDLAQRVRVFNARFEFVDFELTGLSIARRRAPIPSDLMGLAKDKKTQNLLHGTINLIPEDSELSGERIHKLKKTIRFGGSGPSNPYVDSAIEEAQRAGVIIYSIYTPGVGHYGHSFWRMNWGQNYLSQISDETGGESYYLGFGAPVSFAPYLDDLSHRLTRQYLLTFLAKPERKAGFQQFKLRTEVPNAELVAADRVYVPAGM